MRSVSVVAKGLYRTVGGASTTTATKASFTTQDRCNGTLTKVAKGKVVVHDARAAPQPHDPRRPQLPRQGARLFGAKKRKKKR